MSFPEINKQVVRVNKQLVRASQLTSLSAQFISRR